ncbi:MAG: transglutaminase family protein [Rhodobacteraceae bacterium]|nr:transglutaminase family protein [Paracoccaceae bacterium]
MGNMGNLTKETKLLDYNSPGISALIEKYYWHDLPLHERIGSVYNYVRDEIEFGYNIDDAISASQVLKDGYGQCNTKAILLMALLRGVGISCRLHGFTIHKNLQRGVMPPQVFFVAPENIVHSWVEIEYQGEWVNLEGFILDKTYLSKLQLSFSNMDQMSGYGVGTRSLQSPDVEWSGKSTYIQNTAINQDLGLFDTPDDFYKTHRQDIGALKGWLFRNILRHWMNGRVQSIRNGKKPVPLSTFDYEANTSVAQL